MSEYARCEDCGVKTIPWHSDLREEECLCDRCYYARNPEEADPNHEGWPMVQE